MTQSKGNGRIRHLLIRGLLSGMLVLTIFMWGLVFDNNILTYVNDGAWGPIWVFMCWAVLLRVSYLLWPLNSGVGTTYTRCG